MGRQGVNFTGIYTSGVSTTDVNRNVIVSEFLSSSAEWIFWMDADNPTPVGSIPRLLAAGKTFVSGLYYGGRKELLSPIAYIRNPKGTYHTLDQVRTWTRGEIVEVDAVGFGCCLVHRSVYEDIQAKYKVFYRKTGGIAMVHKGDLYGDVSPDTNAKRDGQVHKGVLNERLYPVRDGDIDTFPFYACQFTRTEDMPFCEFAKRAGHRIWVDTSIEAGHIKVHEITGAEYREQHNMVANPEAQDVVWQWEN
jgi:hypothetical protein